MRKDLAPAAAGEAPATPMGRRLRTLRRPSAALLTLLAGVAAVGFGCSSKNTTSTSTSVPPGAVSTTPAAPTTPMVEASSPMVETSSPAASTSGVSGTWSGTYSGTFTGTFHLTWTQTGNNLNGTINLSTSPGDTPLNGTLNGNTITFGTVGSAAVTYTGTISGSHMSGTWQIAGGPAAAGGSWSANKQ